MLRTVAHSAAVGAVVCLSGDAAQDQFRSPMGGLLTERFVPEFTVVSLDSRVLLNTTDWGNGTVSTIAIRP